MNLSLRARLLSGVGFLAVVLALVAVLITTTTRSRLIDQLDDRLAASASDDRGSSFGRDGPFGEAGAGGSRPGSRGPDEGPPSFLLDRQSEFYEGVVLPDGMIETFFSPNIGGEEYPPPDVDLDDVDAGTPTNRFFTTSAQEGNVEYRVLVETSDGVGAAFVTALPLNDVESTIDQLTWIVIAAMAAVLAVLGSVTWWMLRLGITPIKQVTDTAVTIAGGDLSARADESSKAVESRELAVALNTMMGTIESSMADRDESEARLRRFVSDASHELRTPVTTIRGYAELYRIGGLTGEGELDDAMRRTEQESNRMARLVEDMLTLAKLDEQRPIDHRPVDLAQLVRDVVADSHVVAPDRPIEAVAPGSVMVVGDDDRLRQVLANLVNNALTHTDPDVPIRVAVHEPADGQVLLIVIDQGAGMNRDVLDRVTERFFRADPSRSRQRGGSGLGLAIVESTVAAHGGTVHVASTPDTGTTVTVSIPAVSLPSV